jgi:hypothetical protein
MRSSVALHFCGSTVRLVTGAPDGNRREICYVANDAVMFQLRRSVPHARAWLGDGLPVDEIGGGRRSPSHVLCGVSLLNDRRPSKEPDTWAH